MEVLILGLLIAAFGLVWWFVSKMYIFLIIALFGAIVLFIGLYSMPDDGGN